MYQNYLPMRKIFQFFLLCVVTTQTLTSCTNKPVTKETQDHGYSETFEGDVPPMTDVVIATFDTLKRINDLVEALEVHKSFMDSIIDPKALGADTAYEVGRELYARTNAKAIRDVETYTGILREIYTLINGLTAPGLFYDSKEIAEGSSDKLLKYMSKNFELYVRTKNWHEGEISPVRSIAADAQRKLVNAGTAVDSTGITATTHPEIADGLEPDFDR